MEFGSFHSVDHTEIPDGFVQYLDEVNALELVQAAKRRTYSLLKIQPGHRILEIGCGTGDDVAALAKFVGANGHVIGIDNSATMIAEAKKRYGSDVLRVEFHQGDVYHLDYPAGMFDGCRAERLFQHLDRPARALAEIARVVRSGGRIVVGDPDWGTLTIDSGNRRLTALLIALINDSAPNAWSGRQLSGLFYSAGLKHVGISAEVMILNEYSIADNLVGLSHIAAQAALQGKVSEEEVKDWLNDLRGLSREGRFFCTLTCFCASGIKS